MLKLQDVREDRSQLGYDSCLYQFSFILQRSVSEYVDTRPSANMVSADEKICRRNAFKVLTPNIHRFMRQINYGRLPPQPFPSDEGKGEEGSGQWGQTSSRASNSAAGTRVNWAVRNSKRSVCGERPSRSVSARNIVSRLHACQSKEGMRLRIAARLEG